MCTVAEAGRQVAVLRFFISTGHNFFGRHGLEPEAHPVLEPDEVECVAGCGIRGDRFFSFKEDYKGQITFFSLEVFEQLQNELGLRDVGPSAARRNVLTTGVDLNQLIGRRFEIEGVAFEGTEECRPCHWMETALGPGAEAWLRGRGGLRARILTSGTLHRQQLAK